MGVLSFTRIAHLAVLVLFCQWSRTEEVSPELKHLTEQRNAAIERINRTYADQLKLLQERFTREGRLDDALQAREKRSEILKILPNVTVDGESKKQPVLGSAAGKEFEIDLGKKPIKALRVYAMNDVRGIAASSDGRVFETCGSTDGKMTIITLGGNEEITRIEIRPGRKIVAIRIVTNLRATPWIGGTSNPVRALNVPEGHLLTGLSGRTGKVRTSGGESVLTALGLITTTLN